MPDLYVRPIHWVQVHSMGPQCTFRVWSVHFQQKRCNRVEQFSTSGLSDLRFNTSDSRINTNDKRFKGAVK